MRRAGAGRTACSAGAWRSLRVHSSALTPLPAGAAPHSHSPSRRKPSGRVAVRLNLQLPSPTPTAAPPASCAICSDKRRALG